MYEDRSGKRTELNKLGEFGLIEHLTKGIKIYHDATIKGVGDDAAVIESSDKLTLVTTDLMVEGVHFDLSYFPLKHLGYKAAVANFSDIAAMNGTPKQITVSIAVSNRFSLEALEEFYEGLKLACEKYKVDIVGGDTTTSISGLFISITVIGTVDKEEVVYRNTAKEGDLLCVSGNLGAAYLGLLLLEREKQVYQANPEIQPDLEGHDYVLQRQMKPEVRFDILQELKENGIHPTSMIDVSDGLASDVLHICKQSKKGCSIYEDKVPIDVTTALLAEEFKMLPLVAALNGGDDFELLFTVPLTDFDKIKEIKSIHIIGYMTEENSDATLITQQGTAIPLNAPGWDALLNSESNYMNN